jgi:glycosyltransferase involved in cell wall biosynthesis
MKAGTAESTGAAAVVFVVPTMMHGGAERVILTLMMHLDRSRWRPILVTLDDKGPLFEEARAAGIECVFLDLRSRLPVIAWWRLVLLLRRVSARVLVARGFNAATLGRVAALAARTPVICVAEHSMHERSPAVWRALVEGALRPFTSAFFAVCDTQLPYLARGKGIPPDRVIVVHNGIEIRETPALARMAARAAMGVGDDMVVFGIVAGLRPEKDHKGFLHAVALLSARVPEARFVVVGDGPLRVELENLSRALGVQGVVRFLGARDDVAALLPGLDVFCLSSVTEAFPMAVLEAMAAGRPTVATRVGGIPEMIRDGTDGLLVPPGHAESLARAWERLARDPAERYEMGCSAARRARESFSAETMALEYQRAFAMLVERSAA